MRRIRFARTLALAIALGAIAVGPAAARTAEPTKRNVTAKKPAKAKAAKPKAATPVAATDPREEQKRQLDERAQLTERIATLKRQIAEGERSRAGAASALARAERQLAVVNARLHDLDERRRGLDAQAATLLRQRGDREAQLATRRQDLVDTSLESTLNATANPLHFALSGRSPATPLFVGGWLDYAAREQTADIRRLEGNVADLDAQRKAASDESASLADAMRVERTTQETLKSDRVAQKSALDKLSSQLATQRRSASALEADEKRLSRVVEELQRAIDRRAAEERARREAERKRQEVAARKAKPGAPRETPKTAPVDVSPSVASGAFGRLRGSLSIPARGAIVGRFGAPRGDTGASWKGLFIRTADGADVHAVAAGQVVFADYLRGFGNLVIVDHGDQYLSIYGNNDALTKKNGDRVTAGEVVARAGNSSGDDQTGLYFELRFRGRAFDPAGWLGSR